MVHVKNANPMEAWTGVANMNHLWHLKLAKLVVVIDHFMLFKTVPPCNIHWIHHAANARQCVIIATSSWHKSYCSHHIHWLHHLTIIPPQYIVRCNVSLAQSTKLDPSSTFIIPGVPWWWYHNRNQSPSTWWLWSYWLGYHGHIVLEAKRNTQRNRS